MTSQGYGGHHFPLLSPDLVTHMVERDACFRPDPDDPVFLKSFPLLVLIFYHHFAYKLPCVVHQGCEELICFLLSQ